MVATNQQNKFLISILIYRYTNFDTFRVLAYEKQTHNMIMLYKKPPFYECFVSIDPVTPKLKICRMLKHFNQKHLIM